MPQEATRSDTSPAPGLTNGTSSTPASPGWLPVFTKAFTCTPPGFLHFQAFDCLRMDIPDGGLVAVRTHPSQHGVHRRRDHRVSPPGLPGMDVGEVDLHLEH